MLLAVASAVFVCGSAAYAQDEYCNQHAQEICGGNQTISQCFEDQAMWRNLDPSCTATVQTIIAKVIAESVRPVRVLRPTVPAHVDEALQVALEKLPADRFGGVRELAEALRRDSGEHALRATRAGAASTRAATCCCRRRTARSSRARWPNGCSRTACPRACRSSCTRSSGARRRDADMDADIRLVWPLATMVALTFAVWVRLYFERIGEMQERRIHPQKVATQSLAANVLTRTQAADHFRNLFEMPVLFYLGVLVALALGLRSELLLWLAWAYVALRVAHAAIHLTYNRVMHRFSVYVASCIAAWAFWGALVWRIAGA